MLFASTGQDGHSQHCGFLCSHCSPVSSEQRPRQRQCKSHQVVSHANFQAAYALGHEAQAHSSCECLSVPSSTCTQAPSPNFPASSHCSRQPMHTGMMHEPHSFLRVPVCSRHSMQADMRHELTRSRKCLSVQMSASHCRVTRRLLRDWALRHISVMTACCLHRWLSLGSWCVPDQVSLGQACW